MRIPTFSRQSGTTDTPDAERPTVEGPATERPATLATSPSPVRPRRDDATPVTADLTQPAKPAERDLPPAPQPASRATPPPALTRRPGAEPVTEPITPVSGRTPVVAAGPKPRASLLATLGLILGVASALLVLSGPLLGYGIGVAGLALILSLAGIHATGKRHIAGKGDALIGMVLSLGAIVVGVLALTGSLSWLGTDMHPVISLRHWLDAQFVNRF